MGAVDSSAQCAGPITWLTLSAGVLSSFQGCSVDDLVSARYRVEELWRKAYAHQMNGDLAEAIELYRASLATYPTAEAHTFLGW